MIFSETSFEGFLRSDFGLSSHVLDLLAQDKENGPLKEIMLLTRLWPNITTP
jgi:hypothetical protein